MTTAVATVDSPHSPRHGGRFGPATLDELTPAGRRLLDMTYAACQAFLSRCPSPPADLDAGVYRCLYYLIRYGGLVAPAADVQHLHNFVRVVYSYVRSQDLPESADVYAVAREVCNAVGLDRARLAAAELNAQAANRRAAAANRRAALWMEDAADRFAVAEFFAEDFGEGEGI